MLPKCCLIVLDLQLRDESCFSRHQAAGLPYVNNPEQLHISVLRLLDTLLNPNPLVVI